MRGRWCAASTSRSRGGRYTASALVLLRELGPEDLSVAHGLRLGGEQRGGAVAERVDLDDAPAVPVLVGSENSLTALLTSDLLL
jgi:hypothetical protein